MVELLLPFDSVANVAFHKNEINIVLKEYDDFDVVKFENNVISFVINTYKEIDYFYIEYGGEYVATIPFNISVLPYEFNIGWYNIVRFILVDKKNNVHASKSMLLNEDASQIIKVIMERQEDELLYSSESEFLKHVNNNLDILSQVEALINLEYVDCINLHGIN